MRDVFRIVNEQTRLPVESPVEKVLKQGQIVGLANHTVLIRVDGTERPIDDSGNISYHGPIIGLGGVMTWRDAAELILAGATSVGMGTALFVDPALVAKVGRGLEKWELTYQFAASPNAVNLQVGDIQNINKKGWEYLWVRYGDVEDIGVRNLGIDNLAEKLHQDVKIGQDAVREMKSLGLMPPEAEDEELNRQRLVQAEIVPDLFELGIGRLGLCHGDRRVTGQEAYE